MKKISDVLKTNTVDNKSWEMIWNMKDSFEIKTLATILYSNINFLYTYELFVLTKINVFCLSKS